MLFKLFITGKSWGALRATVGKERDSQSERRRETEIKRMRVMEKGRGTERVRKGEQR